MAVEAVEAVVLVEAAEVVEVEVGVGVIDHPLL